MSIEVITLIVFGALIISLLTGCPVGFALGGVGLWLGFFLLGPETLAQGYYATWLMMSEFIFVAVPLFIFMGALLQRSGLGQALYHSLHLWAGPLNGGLAIGSVIFCTLMAAMVGIIGAGIVTMGLIALPQMLKRGYDKNLAVGAIMAGGSLGSLIPPSVAMLVYCGFVGISVGRLFAGGIIPGLILSALFILYIGIRCHIKPSMGPALAPEERGTLRQKVISLKDSILGILLIFLVLGSLFLGVATPSEASAVGAFGALVVCAIYGNLNWRVLRESLQMTAKIQGMVFWLLAGAMIFTRVYTTLGARQMVESTIIGEMNPYMVVALMMFIIVVMGTFVQESAIILIVGPTFNSIVTSLGFDPLWFAILFMVNIQIAQMTPPFGSALFYMKGLIPEENMRTIYRSAIPFFLLQMVGLAICFVLPDMVLWLPNLLIR